MARWFSYIQMSREKNIKALRASFRRGCKAIFSASVLMFRLFLLENKTIIVFLLFYLHPAHDTFPVQIMAEKVCCYSLRAQHHNWFFN